MDSQVTELLGRNRLVDELLRAGLEVALPERDRGIDLIAYADLDCTVESFVARPIQLKAASGRQFSIDAKYAKFPDLILTFVWNLRAPEEVEIYALTYPQSLEIAEEMGWTKTASWVERGAYATTRPSRRLVEYLEPYRMDLQRWREKIFG